MSADGAGAPRSPRIGQSAEWCRVPRGQTQKGCGPTGAARVDGGWGITWNRRRTAHSSLQRVSVCARHHPHLWGVLSAIKARTDFNSEDALHPPSGACPWPQGMNHHGHGRAVLSPADLQDKEDTQLRKVRCLLKIRQNLRGFISFISRPTSINPQLKTISASVWGGSSNGSKLPSYIQER